jgi:hypothetical protein
MVRPRKRRVFVKVRKGFSLAQHLFEAKQVSVDTLTVCCPSSILEVAGYRLTEQFRAVFVLFLKIEQKK